MFQVFPFSGGPKQGDYLSHVIPVYRVWELFWDPEAEEIRGITHLYRFSWADLNYVYAGTEDE